ncbi:MAG: hypothetical protein ACKPKO_43860, partial [Candidatus Fonsibacter sp.]
NQILRSKVWGHREPSDWEIQGGRLPYDDIDYCEDGMALQREDEAVEQHRLLAFETPMQKGLRQHEQRQTEAQGDRSTRASFKQRGQELQTTGSIQGPRTTSYGNCSIYG